ncbi:acyl carrier protein [Lentzea albidocapillata]|nr:acyl carrier protein [Lentzea albidocapillata]
MSEFTVTDLKGMLLVCAGTDDAVELGDGVNDKPFTELGYDSLALLELVGLVQRTYSVPMPDKAVDHMKTPGEAISYINSVLAGVRA